MSARRICLLSFFVICFSPYAAHLAQPSSIRFEIDESKPYTYVQFDHFGARKPVNDLESAKGIWLRLVNNCRLPISVSVLDPGTGDPGVILNYEVVPVGGLFAPDSEQKKKMPTGLQADIGTLATIPPKGDLLFSIPAESVSKHWFIQVRFRFVFPKPSKIIAHPSGNYEPYSVADFTWYNIPEGIRNQMPDASEAGGPAKGREDVR
jgi:hypothetical protein